MTSFQRALKYIKHQLTARNSKGFGIHSPYIFNLVTNIIHDFTPFYCYRNIEKERKKLLTNKNTITITDMGSGSKANSNKTRAISNIAKHSLKQKKQAQLLFRLVNFSGSQNILEIGTSFGITTSYLTSVSSKSKVITLEGCPETLNIAKNVFQNLNLKNIDIIQGNFNSTLPKALEKFPKIDFVFFDGNHTKEATLNYFELCQAKAHNTTVFIFDDIHLNHDMEQAWEVIKSSKDVKVSIDLFHMGIVFFRKEFTKQHFKVRF